ncbi:MAG: DUF2218 domain-containing protein [Proteobacteria bacterium]|nr:DUF2218 domain-containing protein [Pseudomonadota bacterium]
MIVTTAHLSTPNGSKYIAQLCKHFAHKVEVSWDDHHGYAELPSGPAEFVTDASGLSFRLEAADAKGIIQARFTIDVHLATFAHRENFLGLNWVVESAGHRPSPH